MGLLFVLGFGFGVLGLFCYLWLWLCCFVCLGFWISCCVFCLFVLVACGWVWVLLKCCFDLCLRIEFGLCGVLFVWFLVLLWRWRLCLFLFRFWIVFGLVCGLCVLVCGWL